MSAASLMGQRSLGAAHLRGRHHGTPLLGCEFHVSPSFRIHAPFPSDLYIHSSFKFHPKLRSVSTLPAAFTNDTVTLSAGLSRRALPESGLCGARHEAVHSRLGLCPSWSEGLNTPTSPNQFPASFLPRCSLFWREAPG